MVVLGPVGSGKSSLILALLGEMEVAGGRVGVGKGLNVGYAGQSPFVMPGSVKSNLLLGRRSPVSPTFYSSVIAMCQLESDLSSFPNGDETQLGDKGVNLSGGQRAR